MGICLRQGDGQSRVTRYHNFGGWLRPHREGGSVAIDRETWANIEGGREWTRDWELHTLDQREAGQHDSMCSLLVLKTDPSGREVLDHRQVLTR